MKKRIIGATLITVVCALLLSNLVGVLMFRNREMDAARDTLQELLVLMDAQSADTDPQALAEQFSQAAPGKRLTIIDTDGTVLADTEANPEGLEDHNNRPEVEEATATGWGEAVRHSDTIGTSMLYVAKRFADGMIGRASMPLSSIDSLVFSSLWGFLIASVGCWPCCSPAAPPTGWWLPSAPSARPSRACWTAPVLPDWRNISPMTSCGPSCATLTSWWSGWAAISSPSPTSGIRYP